MSNDNSEEFGKNSRSKGSTVSESSVKIFATQNDQPVNIAASFVTSTIHTDNPVLTNTIVNDAISVPISEKNVTLENLMAVSVINSTISSGHVSGSGSPFVNKSSTDIVIENNALLQESSNSLKASIERGQSSDEIKADKKSVSTEEKIDVTKLSQLSTLIELRQSQSNDENRNIETKDNSQSKNDSTKENPSLPNKVVVSVKSNTTSSQSSMKLPKENMTMENDVESKNEIISFSNLPVKHLLSKDEVFVVNDEFISIDNDPIQSHVDPNEKIAEAVNSNPMSKKSSNPDVSTEHISKKSQESYNISVTNDDALIKDVTLQPAISDITFVKQISKLSKSISTSFKEKLVSRDVLTTNSLSPSTNFGNVNGSESPKSVEQRISKKTNDLDVTQEPIVNDTKSLDSIKLPNIKQSGGKEDLEILDRRPSSRFHADNSSCQHYRCWIVILMIAVLSFIFGHLLHDVIQSLVYSDTYSCVMD